MLFIKKKMYLNFIVFILWVVPLGIKQLVPLDVSSFHWPTMQDISINAMKYFTNWNEILSFMCISSKICDMHRTNTGNWSTGTLYLNLPEHEGALPVRILQTLLCHLAVKPVIKIEKKIVTNRLQNARNQFLSWKIYNLKQRTCSF